MVLTVLVLALWLPLVVLAQISSFVVLIVYSMVNLSLVRIKRRNPDPEGVKVYPLAIPVTGFILCTGMIILKAIDTFI